MILAYFDSKIICSGLKLGKYSEILKLCELFQSPSFEEEDEEDEQEELVDEYYCSDPDRETTDPTVMNGRIIALWRSLSSQSPLNYWLEIAIKRSPLVAEILLLDKPLPPLDSNLESYTSGGADEAYLYWQRFGEFWRDPSIKQLLIDRTHLIEASKEEHRSAWGKCISKEHRRPYPAIYDLAASGVKR